MKIRKAPDRNSTEVFVYRIMSSAILFLALASCTRSSEIPDRNTLVVALESMPSSLDPRTTTDANGQRTTGLLFSSLVRIGPNLEVAPDAAESWSYKDLQYRFDLRENLKFSNGREVTKEDLEFSFAQFRDKASPFASQFSSIQSVQVTKTPQGRTEVQIKLSEFNALLLTDLGLLKILPKAECEKAGSDFGKTPVGTGPYSLKSIQNNVISMEANPFYFGEKAKTPKLEIKAIADDNTRFLKVLKGAVDIAQSVLPTSKIGELEKSKDLKNYKYSGPSMSYLLLNLQDSKLRNLYMRQILNLAINRDEIIQFKLNSLATPATSLLHPRNPYFHDGLKPPKPDLEKAQALFRQHKLKGTKLTLKTSNTQEVVEVAKVIASQLEKVGFQVELQSYEWGTYFEDIKKGQFQLAMMRWVGVIDPDIYRLAFHSKEFPPGRNRGRYSNALLDQLLERGVRIENLEERRAHYRKVQEIGFEDLPIIPLWYFTQVAVVHSRVQNYQVHQNGEFDLFPSFVKSE